MAQAAGWFPDPFGRFQQRYHDGNRWTEHVVTDGQQRVDPMGASTVVPFVLPSTANAGGATSASGGATAVAAPTTAAGPAPVWRFLDQLGPDARQRPAASLHTALAGAGGAVTAAGLAVAIIGNDGSRGKAALAGILLIAAGLAIRLFVKTQIELRAAAVGIGVVGIVAVGVAIAGNNLDKAGGWLVIALLFLAAWALPGFLGRPIMLGLGVLALIIALASATSSNDGSSFSFSGGQSLAKSQGTVFLVAAAVLLGLVWLLDKRGYHGVATSLIVAALVSSFIGAFGLVSSLDDKGGTVLIVLVGLAVCIVGSHGDRRATTWYGALMATIGVVAFLVAVMEPTSTSAIGTSLLLAGIILVAVPLIINAVRANRAGGTGTPTAPAAFGPPA